MSSISTKKNISNEKVKQNFTFPAADAQVRLWFLHQLQPSSPVYNIYRAIRMKGIINIDAIEKAINALIVRQGALRTTFNEVDGKIVQTIHANLEVKLNRIDYSNLSSDKREANLQEFMDVGIQQPFDLVAGPLIRVSLVRLSENDHVFFFCVHHLIFDRRSLGILNKEFSDFYQFFSSGESEGLCLLDVSFFDYTQWRLEKISETDLSQQWNYWKENLKNIKPLELPYDGRRSNKISTQGDRCYLDLPSGLIEEFENAVSKHGVTLFMGLLAVFKLLIYRWSGEEDILTGTPFSDRRLKGTENLFGFFVSTLILRTDLSGDPTFTELLSRVRKRSFNSYRYNSMPLDKIIEQLNPERIINRNPLFDLDFQLQKMQPEILKVGDAITSECRASRLSSQYDLGFTIREKESESEGKQDYDIRFEYRTDLFCKETIDSLLKRYKKLLQEVISNSDKKLSEYSVVLEEELESLVIDRNKTILSHSKTRMHQLFLKQVQANPNSTAVITESSSFTYKQIANKAIVLAIHLRQQGVKENSVVAILLSRSEMIPVAMLASFFLKATYLPLDPEYPVSRIEYILNDAAVEHILVEESYSNMVTSPTTTKIYPHSVLSENSLNDIEKTKNINEFLLDNKLSHLAYIIYTSGSTGNPKGVMLTQENLTNFIVAMTKRPGINSKDIILAVTTISFDISVLEILLPLSLGAATIIASRDSSYDPQVLSELLIKHNATIMQATPATWQMMVASGWIGKKDLKLLTGGEALSQKLSDQLQPLVNQVWNMYGPTETTVWSSCYQIENIGQPPLIGKPIANTQMYVLDKMNQLVADGAYGELCIAGEGVSNGYFGQSYLTEKVFIDNPFYQKSIDSNINSVSKILYKTGDLVRFNRDQNIEYVGRMDYQVKVRGYRIELGEIETAINKHLDVDNSVVIIREDNVDDKRIVAYVNSNKLNFDVDSLRLYLQDFIPSYMLPQHFVLLDSFPQTPNGKIDRKLLPIPEFDNRESSNSIVEASSATEKGIVKIWRELTGQDEISVNSNFFDIGGHSLLAMQVISMAKKQLDIEIQPMAMIQDTLAQLAASIDGLEYQSVENKVQQLESVSPQFFSEDKSLFGFYYSSKNKTDPSFGKALHQKSKGAVLLCSPILMENINANWTYRRLAAQLSNEGFDVLRFDYFGTGDSIGYDSDASVDRWKKDIFEASEFLKAKSQHQRISLVGLRFGASLAALSNIDNVDKLILWEPIINGNQYVDELHRKYKNTLEDLNHIRKKPTKIKKGELIGFSFSENLEQTIRSVDLFEGENLKKCSKVVLVSSNLDKFFDFFQKKFKENALSNSITSNATFKNCFVNDPSPGIEKYNDLSAFLPSKSIDVIIQELKD
ncbi:MAG: amino acid adenylation domain-containing protein [Polaribacter sp.]|jgi:amino acid adenylation domain-containing protein